MANFTPDALVREIQTELEGVQANRALNYVIKAINKYERETFYFSQEMNHTVKLTGLDPSGKGIYSLSKIGLKPYEEILAVYLTAPNAKEIKLLPLDANEFEMPNPAGQATNPYRDGRYRIMGDKIYIYVPNNPNTATLRIVSANKIPGKTASVDDLNYVNSNQIILEEAWDLIKYAAKSAICANVLTRIDLAGMFREMEQAEFARLKDITTRRPVTSIRIQQS